MPVKLTEKEKNKLKLSELSAFINIDKLRDPQLDAVVQWFDSEHGLFEMACGVGKTFIQIILFMLGILDAEKQGKKFTGLWACHRLLLTTQVIEEFNKKSNGFFKNHNVEFCKLNSDGKESFETKANEEFKWGVPKHVIYFTTQTSMNDYIKKYDKIQKKSTGINKLAGVLKKIDLYVADEAHKEMSDELVKTIRDCCGRSYFFTATPGEYLKVNLKTLYSYTYADAVKAGYIVKPKLFTVAVDNYKRVDDVYMSNCIWRTVRHMRKSRKTNNKSELVSLVVFLDSVDSVAIIGKTLNKIKRDPNKKSIRDVNIYEIVSDKDITINKEKWHASLRLNGDLMNDTDKPWTKEEILAALKSDKKEKIILNAFMLTEGIDLPEINGVLIGCKKEDASLYQAVSRGCRKPAGSQKSDYNLYVIEEEQERLKWFVEELTKITNAEFDFGGRIVDKPMGSNDDGNDDPPESGNIVDNQSEDFEKLKATIRHVKSSFDSWQIVLKEIDEFTRTMETGTTAERLNCFEKYSVKWEAHCPQAYEKYCTSANVINYLAR